ncbi:hypothetical protein M422DRAFT_269106 [Sphaerobolus stellatus SS14]|uniref:Uncharacterized protein n=1 Tax=Sphaerobolus stellatus (strain SS14) TaxID=990650 RepID=A0A0C9UKX8_SPHS4|nr:hypothetical protein M422DRAFT_269106 [Sphaerobolus stellatus SS14]
MVADEEEEEEESREQRIVLANRKWLSENSVSIVSENSLYWVETRGCATWICWNVGDWKACATCTASNIPCVTTGEAISREKKGAGTPKHRLLGTRMDEEERPKIFDWLGFVKANLDSLETMLGELQDLTRVQVLSQLLTYRLIFGKDHLGEHGKESEEISELEDVDETLGWEIRKLDGIRAPSAELGPGLELGGNVSSDESETASKQLTPKAKSLEGNVGGSEGSEESLELTLDDGEGSEDDSEGSGLYLPKKKK